MLCQIHARQNGMCSRAKRTGFGCRHSSHWYVMWVQSCSAPQSNTCLAWALLGGYRRRIVPHTFDGEAGHFGKLLFRSPLRSLPSRNGCFFLAMFDCWEVTFLGNSTTEGFGGMACVLVFGEGEEHCKNFCHLGYLP
jgi:hypothetical protein